MVGLYLSYYLDTASGGMVVLAQGAAFALVYLFSPRQGLIGSAAGGGPAQERGGARRLSRPYGGRRPSAPRGVGGAILGTQAAAGQAGNLLARIP